MLSTLGETSHQRRSAIERIVLPILSTAVTIVAGVRDSPILMVCFGTVTVLSVLVGLRGEIGTARTLVATANRDRKTRRLYLAKIRGVGERFQRFVDRGTNDTLHGVVQEQPRHSANPLLANDLPPITLWEYPLHAWMRRMNRKISRAAFDDALLELDFLISSYQTFVIRPIFQIAKTEDVATWPARTIRNLDLLSQQLNIFGADYENIIRAIQCECPRYANMAYCRIAVPPLSVGLRAVPSVNRYQG